MLFISISSKGENVFFVPSVNTEAVSAIQSSGATSGGNGVFADGGVLVDKGIVWAKYSATEDPKVAVDSVRSAGSSPSDYSLQLENLDPETRYEVRAYVVVDADTLYGGTLDFYSLSDAPADQDVNFSTSTSGSSGIDISFDNPSSIGADGYLLLRRQDGTYPDLTGIADGQDIPASYPSGTTFITTLSDGDSPYTDSGLNPNQQYHYSIIPFKYDGVNPETYHFLYNASYHSSSSTTDPAASSDLVAGGFEAGSISYASFLSSTISSTSDALRVWRINLRDGGGSDDNDNLATTLTDLTIVPGTGNSVSNWQNTINKAALFVGGTKKGEATPSGNSLVFSGLNISAAQNSTTSFDLYVTFNSGAGEVTDQQRFVFSISSASVNSGGSQLSSIGTVTSTNAAGTNEIDVVAQTFSLSNYPSQLDSGAVFNLDVEAVDNLGNRDLDANFSVSVAATPASATSATGTSQSLAGGIYSWNDLKLHPSQTSIVNVQVTGGGLVAQSFDVLVKVAGVIVLKADTLKFCSQNSSMLLGDIRIVEGSDSDFQPGADVWYTIELPNGYQFIDNSSEDILFSSSSDLSGFDKDVYTNSSRRYNFRFDVNTTNELDTIYIKGLEVEKTGTGSDVLAFYREYTGAIPGESSVTSAVQFKNDPNQQVHGVVLSNAVDNLILNSNKGSGPICEGDEVTFTAYGAGTYDFFIDNVLQSSAANTFITTALQNNDVVKVKGYKELCFDSAQITMNVQTRPNITITSPNYGTIDQNNPNPIQKSSDVVELEATPVGGIFSGTGVKKIGSTNFFDPAEADIGVHAVKYSVTSGVCSVTDSVRFSVESPSGGGFSYFNGLEAKYCEGDSRSLLSWPYDQSVFPVIRYNGPGVVEDPVGSGNWYFDPQLALDNAGPGLTSVYVTYGYSFLPGSEFNLTPQTTFVYARPAVDFSVTQSGQNKSLPQFICGNESSLQLIGNPIGTYENRKIYFTISDIDNNVSDTIDANDPKVFDPADYVASTERNFAITYNYTAQVSGCFNKVTDTTQVLPVPAAITNSDIADPFYCEGESLGFLKVISGSSHFTRWYDRDNSQVVSELDSIYPTIFGTGQKQYEVALVTNNLATCQGPKKIVTVTVNPKPNLTLDGIVSSGYCIDNTNPITLSPWVNGVVPPIPANVAFRWQRIEPDSIDYGVFTQNPVPADYTEGSYIVSYSYTDNNNCSSTLIKNTKINPLPKVDFSGLDSIYCADASPAKLTHNISTSDNPINNNNVVYEIDKNSQGNFVNLGVRIFDPQSILAGVGLHKVRLTYTDNKGCASDTTRAVEVLPLPQPHFSVDKFCVGAPTLFADSSRILPSSAGDSIINFGWQFGDGDFIAAGSGSLDSQTNNGRTGGTYTGPSHEYQNSDDYTVTHIVETEKGCTNSVSKNVQIGALPQASFSALGFCEGNDVKFTDQSSGNLVQWNWDFGDGNSSDQENPSHFYSENGRFNVKLKVYSDLGCSDSLQQEIIKFPVVSSTSLPYTDAFDGTKPEWTVSGENPSWRKDAPDGNRIPAKDGDAWITQNSDTTYNNLENSWVESPCFNLAGLQLPVVNFDLFNDMETDVDGAVLQITYDDGQNWYEIGDDVTGVNWYNSRGLPSNPGMQTTGINYGWTGNTTEWKKAKYALDDYIDTLSTDTHVRFRLAFGSNLTNPGNKKYGGFAFDDFFIGSRNRKVLLEHFTNSGLSSYDSEVAAIEDFIQFKDEELIHLVYHNSYPEADTDFEFNPEDLETRSFYYGISEGPVSVMDGKKDARPFGLWGPAYYDNETLESSPFSISLSNVSTNNSSLALEADITSGIIGADTLNLYVVLAEKEGELFVAREILPQASGQRIEKNWTLGEELTVDINAQTRVYAEPSAMYLIAFLQNPRSNKIYQSTIIPAGSLPGIITGLDAELSKNEVEVFPNPFNDKVNINFRIARDPSTEIKIYDENGMMIFKTDEPLQKENQLDLELLKPGVYLMQLSGKEGVVFKKLIKF